jgi:para-aminobenzoate synthetase
MRVLLIDNYDSFTYNLAHLIAKATGNDPIVVPNDQEFDDLPLDDVDSVVISAGPGRPDRREDFGVSARVLAECRLPTLGVCLGHQGIATMAGAIVVPAPEPRHGRISNVRHDGTELFRGVSSPFNAVRYHSLAVADLPPELQCTAVAEDGVVMALRHRSRALWGLQYHPESICTDFGLQMMRNFTDLVTRRPIRTTRTRAGQCPASPVMAPRPSVASARSTLRLHVRTISCMPDPALVYQRHFAESSVGFWLDSAATYSPLSRFSFMGDANGPLAETIRYRVGTGRVSVHSNAGVTEVDGDIFSFLDSQLVQRHIEKPADLPFEFNLGYVGYLGYELKADTIGRAAHRSPHPDAGFLFADRMVAFDRADNSGWLIAASQQNPDQPGSPLEAERWLDELECALIELRRDPPPAAVDVPHADLLSAASLSFRHSAAAYIGKIEASMSELQKGESYEICLTNMAEADFDAAANIDVAALYRRLREASPTPFGALLRLNEVGVLSSSPERFLAVDAGGIAETRPMKGTRPRGRTEAEDEALRRDLATSEKDRSENLMAVDLARNDLSQVCNVGTVEVPELFAVETFPRAHQLVSTVRGQLRPGATAIDCVRAAFPGASMTGTPKARTMSIIDDLEEGPRGIYAGALGWFGLSGAADLSIVIRTIVLSGRHVSFGIGGAITAMSDPASEYVETLVKARPMTAALQLPELLVDER